MTPPPTDERHAVDVDALRARLDALEARVVALERFGAEAPAGAAAPGGIAAPRPRPRPEAATLLSDAGLALIALGGAYVLRALTEAGTVPAAGGVAAALAYALAVATRGGRALAVATPERLLLPALAGTLIAYPAIVEATLRFSVLSPGSAAALLAAIALLLFAVAVRTHAQAMAWSAWAGASGAAVLLMVQTAVYVPFAAALLVLGVAALWVSYLRLWRPLRWPTAGLAVAGVTLRALAPQGLESPPAVLVLQFALLVGYLGSIAGRTLVRGRDVLPFEVAQTAVLLPLVIGGAYSVAGARGLDAVLFGWGTLAFGLAAYAVAFAFWSGAAARGRNVAFYASLGLALVLAGSGMRMSPEARGVAWAAAALAAAWAAGHSGRALLGAHALVYLVAAAMTSGLAIGPARALAGGATLPGAAGVVALAALGLAWLGLPVTPWPVADAAMRSLPGGLAMWGAAGVAGGLSSAGGPFGPSLATIALSGLAFAAGLVGARVPRLSSFTGLAYLLLALGGLKLLLVDLRVSTPAALAAALAAYGLALVGAGRVARARGTPAAS